MGMLFVGLTTLAALAIVGFGIAGLVDSQRRKQQQHDFLTHTIRQAVFHTASLPVANERRRLRVQPMPLLVHSTQRLLEESGVYPMV